MTFDGNGYKATGELLGREVFARALFDVAERFAVENGESPGYSWDYLNERAATGEGDYADVRGEWLTAADYLLEALGVSK